MFGALFTKKSNQLKIYHPLTEKKRLINKRLASLEGIYRKCKICPEPCGIDRNNFKPKCRPSKHNTYFKESILISEEAIISPSYTVFFQGCNLNCIYCQAYNEIWGKHFAKEYKPAEMASWVNRAAKAQTFSFNGGEPFCHILAALETILHLNREIPIVWKTNLYVSREVLDILQGIIDVYVIDFKASLACSHYITGKHNYFEVIRTNFEYLVSSQKEALFIVRHLQLPGHFECCTKPILEWLRPFASVFYLSLPDYFPCHQALSDPNLNRLVSQEEREKAFVLAKNLGLRLVF